MGYRSELMARGGERRTGLSRRNGWSRANQSLWGQLGNRSPGRIAAGLPDQSGRNTGAGRDQKAGEGEQGPLEAREPCVRSRSNSVG
jgi:hypothetical protein